jgi:hypothetical protein
MKNWEWCFLVILSSVVLIITFITKNRYAVLGTFIVAMYLRKNHNNFKVTKLDRKDGN